MLFKIFCLDIGSQMYWTVYIQTEVWMLSQYMMEWFLDTLNTGILLDII